MKKLTFKISVLALASMTLWGCKKDNQTAAPASSSNNEYQTHSQVEEVFSSAKLKFSEDTANHVNGRIATCGAFIYSFVGSGNSIPGFKENYSKFEITYDGSSCNDGKIRTGKITWYVIPFLKDSLVFSNFTQDGNLVNAYKIGAYNATLSTGGNLVYDEKIKGSITLTDGNTYNYNTDQLYKYLNIFNSEGSLSVSGTSSVDNKKGSIITRYIAINTPVLFRKSCDNYKTAVSGRMEYTNSSFPGFKSSIDLGDGTCDKDAIYTDASGKSYKFTMN